MSQTEKSTAMTISTQDGDIMSAQDAAKHLTGLSQGHEVTGDLLSFEVDDELRAYVCGVKNIPSKNGEGTTPAIRLLTEKAETKICPAAVVVGELLEIAQRIENGELSPAPVLIRCTGETKGKNGTYSTFKIFQLR